MNILMEEIGYEIGSINFVGLNHDKVDFPLFNKFRPIIIIPINILGFKATIW